MKRHLILFLAVSLICISPLMAKEVVTVDDIVSRCRDYIVENTRYPEDKLIINTTTRLSNIKVPGDEISLKVYGNVEEDSLGRLPLKLAIYSQDELYKVIYLVFEVDLKAQAFVTTRWVKREELFSPENLTPVETKYSSLPPDYVKDIDDLEGKVSKVALPKGRVVAYHHLEEPSLIERGQIIRIVASTSNLDIETKGKALRSGKKGEVIKVENIDSGKVIYGKVIDSNTVAVDLY
ncbi:MAG: flagellar basal body P-ring formation protein FlgA [Candidatus Omnitrophica bacterium]|nr:flagellar basal body P-ring formation protein FlgA [Candidatus Omnitrophota bacterium]MBD3269248.1 flagellar basal body P-ring formation protein FlgA [Candidatus Omnitrophota bacterium]